MTEPLLTRPLTADEHTLVKWMLEHGNNNADASLFLPQLEIAQATSWSCPCGCASFNIALKGHEPAANINGMHVLADYIFGPEDQPSGIFVFEIGGLLAGLEVYGLASDAPIFLPDPETLR